MPHSSENLTMTGSPFIVLHATLGTALIRSLSKHGSSHVLLFGDWQRHLGTSNVSNMNLQDDNIYQNFFIIFYAGKSVIHMNGAISECLLLALALSPAALFKLSAGSDLLKAKLPANARKCSSP